MTAVNKNIYQDNPKELLYHIIVMAKNAGYRFSNFLDVYDAFSITSFNPETGRMVLVLKSQAKLQLVYDSVYLLFFDLSFAKAIFKNDWEQHLVELAKADSKIQYLANHLNISEHEPRITS